MKMTKLNIKYFKYTVAIIIGVPVLCLFLPVIIIHFAIKLILWSVHTCIDLYRWYL